MDNRLIRKGATLFLPVFVEGALLSLGDIHAAMGDGEVFGQGIEIDAEVELTVTVNKNLPILRPLVVHDDLIACVASHSDIYQAKEFVLKDMGDYLAHQFQLPEDEIYCLIAFYGDLRFCQIVNPQKTVRMELNKRYIQHFLNRTAMLRGN